MRDSLGAKELVVIGGSRGAVEALEALLPALPSGYPLAVVVVVHQYRHAGRTLPELLRSYCALEVAPIHDKDRIQPGRVYVCPANYHLLVEPDRSFSLSIEAPVNFARPSLDVAFESAARVYGEKLVAVLLSGASADGAVGLKEVRARGGAVACQDPATSAEQTMPRAGCQAGTVDWLGSPPELGRALAELRP